MAILAINKGRIPTPKVDKTPVPHNHW